MLRFSVDIPKKPASRKVIIAFVFCLSWEINRMLAQIRKKPIIFWRKGYIFGTVKMKIGMMKISDKIARVEPMRVNFRA